MRGIKWLGLLSLLGLLGATASGLELEIEVRDGRESAVERLGKDDFDIEFGGKVAVIEKLRYVEGLAETKLYIAAEMPPTDLALVQAAVGKLIEGLPEGLEVSLGGAPFTSDKAKLREYLALGTELPGKSPDAGFAKLWDFGQAYRVQGRPVLASYAQLASQLAAVPGQKRVILYRPGLELRQDGLDTRDMNIRSGQLRQNDANLLRNDDDMQRFGTIAAASRVRFYTTNATTDPRGGADRGQGGLSGRSASRRPDATTNLSADSDHGLTGVALHTGGKAALGGGNADDVVRTALEHLPGYYVATIDPELQGKGVRKNIKVSVSRKGVDADFPRGFLMDIPGLGSLGAGRTDLLAKESADATMQIQSRHWVFRGPDGKPMVLISAGAPAMTLESSKADKGVAVELALAGGYRDGDGWLTTANRVSRQVFDKKAFAAAQKKGGVTIDVTASGSLPGPGMHAWKTVLRNTAGGAFGVIEEEVGAHDLNRPMATSDVLLTRLAVPIEADAPAEPWGDLLDFGGSRMIPESTNEFKVGEPVLFTYRLYNAPKDMIQNPPPVQLALFKDEQQLDSFDGQGQSRVVDGKAEIQYVGSIQTKGLGPGEYLILSAVPGREDERQPYVEGAFRLVKK